MSAPIQYEPKSKLCLIVHEQAVHALQDHAVEAARAAASQLAGVVIQNQDDAAIINDQLGAVKRAVRTLMDLERGVLRPLREGIEDAQAVFAPVRVELQKAIDGGNSAVLRWDADQRRRAAEDAARVQRIAGEALKKAQQEAEMMGLTKPETAEEAGVAVFAPPEPEKVIRGGTSTTYVQRRMAVALHNPMECDARWLRLDAVAARQAADAAEKVGFLKLPETAVDEASAVLWHGLKVWKSATAVTK